MESGAPSFAKASRLAAVLLILASASLFQTTTADDSWSSSSSGSWSPDGSWSSGSSSSSSSSSSDGSWSSTGSSSSSSGSSSSSSGGSGWSSASSSSWSSSGDGWSTGRATFYGMDGGATIDQGSCMYGPLPNDMVSTGVNIAALSDKDPDFAGSCGRCYEVMCNPSGFSDGYGQYLDRNGACYGSGSVVVTITDSCPCDYPNNAHSNRRWCCGDMYHMDLSTQAFQQLADVSNGVIGIKYRQVDCPGGFKPSPRGATWDYPQGTGR